MFASPTGMPHDDEHEDLVRRLHYQDRVLHDHEVLLENQHRALRRRDKWLRLGVMVTGVVALASMATASLGLVTASEASDSANQAKHCSIAVADVSRLDQTRAAANRVQDGHLTQDEALALQEQLVDERAALQEEVKVRGCIDEEQGRRMRETLNVLDEAIHNLHGVSVLLETPHASPPPTP